MADECRNRKRASPSPADDGKSNIDRKPIKRRRLAVGACASSPAPAADDTKLQLTAMHIVNEALFRLCLTQRMNLDKSGQENELLARHVLAQQAILASQAILIGHLQQSLSSRSYATTQQSSSISSPEQGSTAAPPLLPASWTCADPDTACDFSFNCNDFLRSD